MPTVSAWARLWPLDPGVTFLNHGSFGACPRVVIEAQRRLQDELEAEPVRFLSRDLEGRLDRVRADLGAFLGADPDDLAFVPNATAGVNTVLRSLPLTPGDEVLVTDHGYNACRNAATIAAGRAEARVVVATVPFPVASPDQVLEAVLARVTPRTRLALLDHVTSPTGIIFPIARLVSELAARGVDTLVDGAHAPGMLPLDLRAVGAAYYTGNAHKWLCAPKGTAFLHVRRDRQAGIRPLSISHGTNSPRTDRSRFRLEFDWGGTGDPTGYLTIPEALRYMGTLLPGGWPALMAHNHAMVVEARAALCAAIGIAPPCPDTMLGSLASMSLPPATEPPAPASPRQDPLHGTLFDRFAIEVPVMVWPAPPRRLIRVSAQIYNAPEEYARLAGALRTLLASPA